jgi:hypothetical protein
MGLDASVVRLLVGFLDPLFGPPKAQETGLFTTKSFPQGNQHLWKNHYSWKAAADYNTPYWILQQPFFRQEEACFLADYLALFSPRHTPAVSYPMVTAALLPAPVDRLLIAPTPTLIKLRAKPRLFDGGRLLC